MTSAHIPLAKLKSVGEERHTAAGGERRNVFLTITNYVTVQSVGHQYSLTCDKQNTLTAPAPKACSVPAQVPGPGFHTLFR